MSLSTAHDTRFLLGLPLSSVTPAPAQTLTDRRAPPTYWYVWTISGAGLRAEAPDCPERTLALLLLLPFCPSPRPVDSSFLTFLG